MTRLKCIKVCLASVFMANAILHAGEPGFRFPELNLQRGTVDQVPHSVKNEALVTRVSKSKGPAAKNEFTLDQKLAQEHLRSMSSKPHPFGSQAQEALGAWIYWQVSNLGLKASYQHFVAEVPSRRSLDHLGARGAYLRDSYHGRNIIARLNGEKTPSCLVAVGSHYDSKHIDGGKMSGANDGLSTSALLLQLAGFYRNMASIEAATHCQPIFIWFDGEESVLPGWDDSLRIFQDGRPDNTYGSRFFAGKLGTDIRSGVALFEGVPLLAFILLDMLGSPNLKITNEAFSDQFLKSILQDCLTQMGQARILTRIPIGVLDDHIPFLKRGIPSLNIIDFENLKHWHQSSDSLENISYQSLALAGRIARCTIDKTLNSFH